MPDGMFSYFEQDPKSGLAPASEKPPARISPRDTRNQLMPLPPASSKT